MYFESKLTLLFCWPVFFGLLFWPRFSGVEATDYQGRQASGRINQFLKHWSISELPSAQQKDSSKIIQPSFRVKKVSSEFNSDIESP
jgi:hypothetical protein